ncbi:MAG: PepSY domain-containing protein [Hyphomicrobiaceae bacterium]|nr:PepSY domain-containing protein [Hyphomicrobiaceae bacterium]
MLASPVEARRLDPDDARKLMEKGDILPLEQIMKINERELTGRIIEVELERKRGMFVYEIKILPPDGRRREFYIDARTGEIIRRK